MSKPASTEGHGAPCYYCGKPCNGLAGNPSEWPIPLCHADKPGKVKWHHIGCVSARLREREPIPCGHTRGDLWSEMHATAEPYCTICRLHTEREEAAADAEVQEERADRLAEALKEALDGWERVPCAGDKRDAEVIARLRALLPDAPAVDLKEMPEVGGGSGGT